MPKRKAASRNKQSCPVGAMKPRTTGAAAAAVATEATSGSGSADSALARGRLQLVGRIATQTRKLDAIRKRGSCYTHRMQAVAHLLKTDAGRPKSLLDLSLVVEGEKSCVLFRLLAFFCKSCKNDVDSGSVKADKSAAQQVIADNILPLRQRLLRSFDPTTVNVVTGNNALHEMCRNFALESAAGWPFRLCKLLIERGVSVHARNKKGRTPLLQRAASCTSSSLRTEGMRLLLKHGADLNAQDDQGDGVLHLLIRAGAETRLSDLLGGDGVGHLDHTLRNNKDETAADLAASRLAKLQDSEEAYEEMHRARHIQRLVQAQTAKWIENVRPELLRHLEPALSVTDLAKLALGYIDGSGLLFVTATEAESDEDDEPAAAVAAAVTS